MDAHTHRCGHHLDDGLNPDTVAVVEDMVCAYCRAVERVERTAREKHDDDWADGRFWFAREYDPEQDKKKRPAERKPEPSRERKGRGRLSRG